jgi:hypothetical protein
MPRPIRMIQEVAFRAGSVEWEDAFGQMRAPLPDFVSMRKGTETIGKVITTIGLVAKIGRYVVIVTELGHDDGVFDFTIVPLRPKVKIKWTGGKS